MRCEGSFWVTLPTSKDDVQKGNAVLKSPPIYWENMLVFAYMFCAARRYMYRVARLLFVVQIFCTRRHWQKEPVNGICSDKRNSHEREQECRMPSELACLWSTDGCLLKVSGAMELAAREGMCTLEETSCCSLAASLHSEESTLLFHTNTWPVRRNCYINPIRDKDTQIMISWDGQELFPFLHGWLLCVKCIKTIPGSIIRHKQLYKQP